MALAVSRSGLAGACVGAGKSTILFKTKPGEVVRTSPTINTSAGLRAVCAATAGQLVWGGRHLFCSVGRWLLLASGAPVDFSY